MILGVGPTFHRSNLQMEIPPSPLSLKYRFQLDSIYEPRDATWQRLEIWKFPEFRTKNFVGNLAMISETRGEASFEWEALGDRSRGKDPASVVEHAGFQ
ncbi:hypothetical protein H5410_002805 [Solanum commersonii]|uniref:Uncharacterized protein n=1 Tax=Solanum commersonii TaxID=4109 RepID=A0A9J6B376_SOLCO|nr:hypothetical protein H5410_002805 [Solanum commersonii]